MKKRIFTAALATAALSWSVGLVSAQSSGTAAEARAMLDSAVAALNSPITPQTPRDLVRTFTQLARVRRDRFDLCPAKG